MTDTVAAEPTAAELFRSYKTPANVRLARAIHPLMSHCAYDRHVAHRWALKLIATNPQSGEDVIRRLMNYDWMVEGAVADYRAAPIQRRKYDAVFEAFRDWQASLLKQEAA